MFEYKPYGATTARPAPRPAATRTVRKIALCGSHSASLVDAPWDDPSWEFWGHASSRAWYRRVMDRYFDLHPPACRDASKRGKALYAGWLKKNTVPCFMQKHYPEIPASVAYPKGRILMEFAYAHRRQYFTNHTAWMIALAIAEGVTHIGLFGINYSAHSEYERQRGSAEYWLGQLDGRGITVLLPDQCSLLSDPALLYGYDSHDEATGILKDEYKPKVWRSPIVPMKPGEKVDRATPPEKIRTEIEAEEKEHPRPAWAEWPEEIVALPTDGSVAHGNGISVRLVAPGPDGTAVPRVEGLNQWVGTPTPFPWRMERQEPTQSLQAPSNGACQTPETGPEAQE